MDLLDNTLKDSQEIERYLRIPNLAMIPEAPKERESLYPAPLPPETRSVNGVSKYFASNSVTNYNGNIRSRRGLPQSAHRVSCCPVPARIRGPR